MFGAAALITLEDRLSLRITWSANQLIISWNPAMGTLQEADSVTGPWNDLTGATSPYIVSPTSMHKFYRVRL